MIRLYPHETLTSALSLHVSNLLLDGKKCAENPYVTDHRLIQLFDDNLTSWDRLSLDIEMSTSIAEAQEFSKKLGNLSGTVVAHCPTTQFRSAFALTYSPTNGKWFGSAELMRPNLRGKVVLVGLLTATVDARPAKILCESSPWTINVDEPSIPNIDGTLKVQWADFSAPDEGFEYLKRYKDQPTFADLNSVVPTLYLNKGPGYEAYPTLLDDRTRSSHLERALHNSERASIAQSVWIAMANTAVASIEPAHDGSDPSPPHSDWKAAVLDALLPAVYPNTSRVEALRAASAALRSPDGSAAFESQVLAAVGSSIGLGKLLRRTLLSLTNADLKW